jgi:hypothetical protein
MNECHHVAADVVASKVRSARLTALLANDIWFWRAAVALLSAIAILKGLRLPSLWAATQANLDYHQGFIKRGLFGQLAHSLAIPIAHYDVFVLLSGFLLLVLLLLLARWVSRSGALRLADGKVVAVFGASFALTYLVHLIGYLEIPLAILALIAVSISPVNRRLIAALVAGCLGVLIHESYVLVFLPITLLPAFLAAIASGSSKASTSSILRSVAPIAAVVAAIAVVLLVVALGAPMTAQRAGDLQAAMTAAVDFPTRGDFFPVLTRSAADNLAIMMATMTNGSWWLTQCNAFVTFMPTAGFFLWISLNIVDTHHVGAVRAAKAAIAFASLCPLVMQLVGWDIYRWYALAALSSFVSLTIVCRHYGCNAPLAASGAVRNIALLLIAVNMATGTGLFDGHRVDTFPFVDFWKSCLHWVVSGGHFTQPSA